jgi:hypothetical protein
VIELLAARRVGQGAGGFPGGCCRRGQAGERFGRADERTKQSARRAVALDAGRSPAVSEPHWLTAVEAAKAIAARKLSPVELMTALLERIGRLDPKLNVFIRLDGEAAMHGQGSRS